ncbi:DUF488 domain-containing protein [Nesterenkonia sp. F]|uniref:DUF488 domain-containing protein n=1 Tax=Nesterenkonia sp. F TaxID=795955 RepID=UPI000255CFFE|nr:DUF488 family protein [Nesterenkonia sp. F]
MTTPEIRLKRVHDDPSGEDGPRVLVDRLWPRGVSKERAAVDLWPKDVAPSPELRRLWHHDPERFEEFAAAYRAELADCPAAEALAELREQLDGEPVATLLFAAKDRAINHAVVLAGVLAGRAGD